MGFNCGIVGLPNVGKSTLFNALLGTAQAAAANYPFCTIEPNVGVVEVPDPRLKKLAAIDKPAKVIPAIVEFVDIAGLVRGGKAKLIGVATPAQLPQFAGVPTVSESGLPGFTFSSWFTIMAPAGTPKEIIARLHGEIMKALADPAFKDQPREAKIAKIRSIVNEIFDYTELSKRTLGREWAKFNAQQQAELMRSSRNGLRRVQ